MNFNISAAVVRQLGEELVSDEVTAILELVKNAYDADAEYVNVVIDTDTRFIEDVKKPCPNGYVTIEDNGSGMDLSEIENGWLIISLSKKREMKRKGQTTIGNRVPLGDKGLGRLSTQRIGNALDMITSKADVPYKIVVSFNWGQFDTTRLLTDVTVDLDELPNPKKARGTKLIISELRDPKVWEGEFRKNIQNKLSQLISPFEKGSNFRVFLTINGEKIQLFEIANRLREAALSTFSFEYNSTAQKLIIKGKVRLSKLTYKKSEEALYYRIIAQDQGREFFTFLSDPANKDSLSQIEYSGQDGWFLKFHYDIDLNTIPGLNYSDSYNNVNGIKELYDPGSFYGEIDEFSLVDNNVITNVYDKISEYKEFVKQQVGVRVFRDGFGIRPYGYQGYDWLQLGSSQTSGSSFYGLRPNNVIGYVELGGSRNKNLKEKTDREGFVENPYSQNFFILMGIVRDRINNLVEGVRRSFTTYKNLRSQDDLNLGEQSLDESFKAIHVASKQVATIDNQVTGAQKAIGDAQRTVIVLAQQDQKEEHSELLIEINKTLTQANELVSKIKLVLPQINKLSKIATYLEPKIETIENQLIEFTELASLGLTTESLSHELVNVSNNLDLRTKAIDKILKNKNEKNTEVTTYIEFVRSTVATIRKQLSHISPALKFVRESKDIISIVSFINDTISYYKSSEQASQISFEIMSLDKDFKIVMNKGKLTQVFDNIILNAIYWLKENIRLNNSFIPAIYFEISGKSLIIWDNGIGIDRSVEQSIFQPFVTTKPRGAGRGLGLFIVRQLLDTLNCTIFLRPERNASGRRYKFEINFSNVVQNV